ncbi:MAG: 4Fe-4S dicluster domain-containing protein [Thermomicrobiales bacterium]|nr:4Fe-4S dicluster domain-containing protein [Thermomicrobiales bacterium]
MAQTPVAVPAAEPTPGSELPALGSFEAVPTGFYTDTTVCIGCKACEVACKEWNGLPATNGGLNTLSGDSYDNTRRLDGEHWRHVKFIEQFSEDRSQGRWLMMSDVCKHCVQAGCLEVCPTGAIMRTEFDTVVIQADICNGCRYCIAACPFGVIEINPVNNTAMKCTLCYDRMQNGLVPACAKACPTSSIQFGPIAELKERAKLRVDQLNKQARDTGKPEQAYLYGADETMLGGLNSFYLLEDQPEVYGLPRDPKLPSRNQPATGALAAVGAVALGALGVVGLRKRRMDDFAAEARDAAANREATIIEPETPGPEEERRG